jgi:DNA-binding Xre family transcriptional regulator
MSKRRISDPARIRAEEELCLQAQRLICEMMVDRDVNQRELARRLGVSEARTSQLLVGGKNMTLRTLAAALHALGTEAEISLAGDHRG